MARKKSRISKSARSGALEQLKAFKEAELSTNQEVVEAGPQISNQELLEELKIERKEQKLEKKRSKRSARYNMLALKQEDGPKATISYANAYQPGMLVTITKRAAKRHRLENVGLFEGACGVIVEQNNAAARRGDYEEGRWLNVMGPNGLQQWDVRWCETLDEEDEG
jgi:hypothetical protein